MKTNFNGYGILKMNHTEKQLEEKRRAIDMATESLAIMYLEGSLEGEHLYHKIESLNELVKELKRG